MQRKIRKKKEGEKAEYISCGESILLSHTALFHPYQLKTPVCIQSFSQPEQRMHTCPGYFWPCSGCFYWGVLEVSFLQWFPSPTLKKWVWIVLTQGICRVIIREYILVLWKDFSILPLYLLDQWKHPTSGTRNQNPQHLQAPVLHQVPVELLTQNKLFPMEF